MVKYFGWVQIFRWKRKPFVGGFEYFVEGKVKYFEVARIFRGEKIKKLWAGSNILSWEEDESFRLFPKGKVKYVAGFEYSEKRK
jgi:hypothetical protein